MTEKTKFSFIPNHLDTLNKQHVAAQRIGTPGGPQQPLPHRRALATLPPEFRRDLTAQHLGVTDPVTTTVLRHIPELGKLRPFTTNGIPWTVIGHVVVWGNGEHAQRTEHHPAFARQLVVTAIDALTELIRLRADKTLISARQLLQQVRSPLTALYPELQLLDPDTDFSPFISGGLRSGRLYRAALPGADAPTRAALQRLTERLPVTQISKLRTVCHMASLLIRCADLRGAQALIEHVGHAHDQQGYVEQLTPGDLRIMQAAKSYHMRVPEVIYDSRNLLRDLLSRLDLWQLSLINVRHDVEHQRYFNAEGGLSRLRLDRVTSEIERRMRLLGLNFNAIPLKAVSPTREMTLNWGEHTWTVTAAATNAELAREGERLEHCVGGSGYVAGAVSGQRELYFLRPRTFDGEGTSGLTAEVRGRVVTQLRGHRNRPARGEELIAAQLWMQAAGLTSAVLPEAGDLPVAVQSAVAEPQQQRIDAVLTGKDAQIAQTVQAEVRAELLEESGLSEQQAQEREAEIRREILALLQTLDGILSAPPLNPGRYARHGTRYLIEGQWAADGDTLDAPVTLSFDAQTVQLHLCGQQQELSTEDLVSLNQFTVNRTWVNTPLTDLSEVPGLAELLAQTGHTGPVPATTAEVFALLRRHGSCAVPTILPGTATPNTSDHLTATTPAEQPRCA